MSLGKWIGLLALLISLYILWQFRQVLLLVFTAVVLANILNVLVRRLKTLGVPRPGAILLSITLLLTFLIGFFWLIVPAFASQFQDLSQRFPVGLNRLNEWLDYSRSRVPSQLVPYLPDVEDLTQQIQPIVNQLLGRSVVFVSSSFGFFLNLLLVLILTLMLLVDPQPYQTAFTRLFPSFYRRRVKEILGECEIALKGWLAGILFNMFVITTLSGLGLWILGIPLVLAQALLAGILTFIPNIGPALSVVPPMMIALLEAPWKSVAVLVLYVVIQQIETNLLTPYVMAQQVSLLPAVTLLSQVFFATFFGFLGLLLALPLTVVGQVWVKEVLIKDVLDQWRSPEESSDEEPESGVLVQVNANDSLQNTPQQSATEPPPTQTPPRDQSGSHSDPG